MPGLKFLFLSKISKNFVPGTEFLSNLKKYGSQQQKKIRLLTLRNESNGHPATKTKRSKAVEIKHLSMGGDIRDGLGLGSSPKPWA